MTYILKTGIKLKINVKIETLCKFKTSEIDNSLFWCEIWKQSWFWVLPRPPPPPHSVLFRVRICSFPPFESTPYISGLTTFLNPPFTGFSQAFPALETPLNPKHCSMYPPIFLFYNPLFKFLRHPKRERKKTTPLFKEIAGWKVKYPLFFFLFFFYNSRAGLCRTKSTPLPEILGTRMRSLRPRSGGPGV